MLRKFVTKDCLYWEAEEDEISVDLYEIDEDELTIHYAEESYDKIVQVDFEDIPICPLATMDCSIYAEIQIAGADNTQPVATASVHPNAKSVSVQVVQEQEEMTPLVNIAERRSRPEDLPENINIHVPEELSPAALLLNDFFVTDEDEFAVYYAEETYEKMVQVNFEDIPTCPMDARFYSETQITAADSMPPVATEMVEPVKNEQRRSCPEDLPENVIFRLPQDFCEYTTDEEELTVYYVEEAYNKIAQVNTEDIPRCPLAYNKDSVIYSDIQFEEADNIHPIDKSTQTDVQVIRRPVQMVQEQEDLIQVVQEQEEIMPLVDNEERPTRHADRPQNIVILAPEELSNTAARRILSTDQLLCIATVCVFTALGMCLIVGIGLITSEELFES